MEGFNFTNEEILWVHKHFTEYCDLMTNKLLKQLKFTAGQLELSENLYGNDKSFNREEYELQLKLVKEELPKEIKQRITFIRTIRKKFDDAYDAISEIEPDLLESVQQKYFGESEAVKTILDQINNNKHGEY